jgi:hypothetical protein
MLIGSRFSRRRLAVIFENNCRFFSALNAAMFLGLFMLWGVCSLSISQEEDREDRDGESSAVDSFFGEEGISKDEIFARSNELNQVYSRVKLNKIKQAPSTNIILHFKGNSGVKFKRVELDQKAWEEIKKSVSLASKENYEAMLSAFDKEVHETETIPLCKESKVRILDPGIRSAKGAQIKSPNPVLMIQRDLIPQDEKIAYGITTKLMSFEVDTLAGLPEFLKMTGFSCLPVRMHVTKKGLVLIEGEDAIKNYDQDEKGRLDKGVERLWQALKIRYRSNKKEDLFSVLSKDETK